MSKIKFKCKGFLKDGSPCDKLVTARMHSGISRISGNNIQVVVEVTKLKIEELKEGGVPNLPSDWEFTLICSREHEDDYSYNEREQ